jgi:predicted Zn-dependent protease
MTAHTTPGIASEKNTTIIDAEVDDLFHLTVEPLVRRHKKLQNVLYLMVLSRDFNAFAVQHGSELHPSLPHTPCIAYHAQVLIQESFYTFAMILFHELGHLSGNHRYVLPSIVKENQLSAQTMALGVGGVLSAVAGNLGPLLLALPIFQLSNASSMCTYSKQNEASADRFAYQAFQQLQWSLEEPLATMKRFGDLEFSGGGRHFLRTHPFWKERREEGLRYLLTTSQMPSASLLKHYDRVRIKLIALMAPLDQADRLVNQAPVISQVKDYGRAIVAWRRHQFDKALAYTQSFVKAMGTKDDVYVHGLRAEILLAKGQPDQALKEVNLALLLRKSWTLDMLKSHILHRLPAESQAMIQWTLPLLHQHPLHCDLWIMVAKAYERSRIPVGSLWCLSEHWAVQKKWDKALHYAQKAQKLLSATPKPHSLSPTSSQLADLIQHLLTQQRKSL